MQKKLQSLQQCRLLADPPYFKVSQDETFYKNDVLTYIYKITVNDFSAIN